MMSSPFLSDEELLQQVAGGDPAAYDVLYQRYHARLGRFLASWLNDPWKTEDLTHEVLLEVWKSAGTYRGRSQVSTWIFGIACFKALTARRHQAEVLLPDADAMRAEGEESGESPEEVLLQEERVRMLHAALQELSPSHWEVLQLAYGAGCTGEETAGRVGCPLPTVPDTHIPCEAPTQATPTGAGGGLGVAAVVFAARHRPAHAQ